MAAPRPLHLNAYRLRNDKQVRTSDSGASEQLYSMLTAADDGLIERLKRFLGRGTQPADFDIFDETAPLDLDTIVSLCPERKRPDVLPSPGPGAAQDGGRRADHAGWRRPQL